MAGGAPQFNTLFGMFSLFQAISDSRDDHDSRTVFFVATNTRSGLGDSHTDPFNQCLILRRNWKK
jgi:hypothetical protein